MTVSIIDKKGLSRGSIKINLFDIATGPFHHDYSLKPLKVKILFFITLLVKSNHKS